MTITGLSKTTNFETNVKVEIRSLTVDVDASTPFDIYKYFQISLPDSLISEWNMKKPLPFICEVECIIFSKGRAITCPIIFQSKQYKVSVPTIPAISNSHQIQRVHHVFEWNRTVEFPLFYSELPSDSAVSFTFYAKLFQTEAKMIGRTYLQLFTKRTPRLRLGFFPLTFDEKKEKTKLEKHIRRLYTGKDKEYKFIDDQLQVVNSLFHPKDAEKFYRSLLSPMQAPEISTISQYAHVFISSPAQESTTLVIHDSLLLPSSKSPNSLNPSQRLYHDLAHSTSGFKSTTLLKDSKVTNILNKVKMMGPLAELQPNEVVCLFNNFRVCFADQALMPALFRSVNWDNKEERNEIVEMLKDRAPIDAEYALEFFTSRYNQKCIRQFAVRCVKAMQKEEALLYLPQLLQACKQEYTEGLDDILIEHASGDPIFASTLYWNAQCEKNVFAAILKKLEERLTDDVKKQLDDQKELQRQLEALLSNHPKSGKTKEIREVFVNLLHNDPVYSKLQNFPPVRLPLDPKLFVVGLDVEDIKVFKSKLCPVCLSFKVQGSDKRYRVIFKIGDDMRQDQLIIQLFEVMDHIFKSASMQLHITAYKVLAFSETFGCCQFIDNSKAILDIAKDESIKTIMNYLADENGNVDPAKIERFTESLAAYCVMTYVLKIGDRHDNNILVTKDGRLLHIDYGFILGDVTKPFTPPLKLSKEMMEPLGPNGMQRLCDWACPAFNSLRKRARLILVLIELMFTAPLECFQQDPHRRLQQVENSLILKCTEIEASKSLQATFAQSLNSKMQVFWDYVHVVAVSTNGGNAEN